MPPLADRNNNPGDLRFIGQQGGQPGQGGFAEFPDKGDGDVALVNDIQSKINKSPDESLLDFSHGYAPETDGNDSVQYALNLANKLGVAPDTKISSLESRLPDFASAIASNEGYKPDLNLGQTAGQVGQAAGKAYNAVGPQGAVALGGLGAVGADVLGAGEGLLSGAEGAVGNVLKSIGIGAAQKAVFGDQTPQSTDTSGPTSTMGSLFQMTQPNEPAQPAKQAPVQQSSLYGALADTVNQTISGQKVIQEGQNRGIDPIAVLEQTGAASALQPDENGNFNKVPAVALLNNFISQDKSDQRDMVATMTSPTHLFDLQKDAEDEVGRAMQDTGERERALKEVQRIFDDYRSEQPTKVDAGGKSYVSQFIAPHRLQKKKELLSVSENDFARPKHERSAAAHVKEAMRKRLSEIAKQENVKGWDETNKRMESMILARKAIVKMPKKAQRDRFKEFRKDLTGAVLGGVMGKMLGNSTLGTIGGYLLERQLSRKEYQKLGSEKDREAAASRSTMRPQKLLTRVAKS